MNARTRLFGLIVLLLLGGVTGFWFVRSGHQRDAVVPWVPVVPATAGFPAPFADALQTTTNEALSRGSAREGLRHLSALYHANGFFTEAITCYEGLAQLEPEEARWPHLHASILAGFGQADAALDLWDRVTTLAPDYLPARLRIGDVALKANDLPRARAAYEAALAVDAGNPYALHGLARIELENGHPDAALRILEDVVRRSNYTIGYDLIVTLYENTGQDAKALAIRGRKEASGAYRDPADPWLDGLIDACYDPFRIALAAGSLAGSGERDDAIALLQRALELDPSDVSIHYQIGNLYLDGNQLDDAIAEFRQCTLLDPGFADGWGKLSAAIAQTGRIAEAEALIETGLKAVPDSPSLHQMRARRQWANGNIGAAIADYRAAIRLRPAEAGAYVDLGMLLSGQARAAEAVRMFETALIHDPLHPTALTGLSFQAIEAGDRAAADGWLAKVALQPRIDRNQVSQLREAYRKQFGELPSM